MSVLNPEVVGFYALSVVAVIASLRVIVHKNPVHAILSMIVSLLSVAGIFFILGAPFAGVLEIIVYAGAILVLFVFVIMMLNLGHSTDEQETAWLSAKAWAMPVALTMIVAVVLGAFVLSQKITAPIGLSTDVIDAKTVGVALFTRYGLLVQVAAFLLLGALVAAYHLGKKALDDENESHFQDDTQNDTPQNLIQNINPSSNQSGNHANGDNTNNNDAGGDNLNMTVWQQQPFSQSPTGQSDQTATHSASPTKKASTTISTKATTNLAMPTGVADE